MKLAIEKEAILSYFSDKKIAVLCGGMSDEREVSLRSGKNVYEALSSFDELNVSMIDVDETIAVKLKEEKPDYVYNTLHGSYGEDGAIQGLLEIMKIPYTGEGILASALSMDKMMTKRVWRQNGVRTPESALLSRFSGVFKEEAVFDNGSISMSFPIVVKHKSNGSSVGVYMIKDAAQLHELLPKLNAEDYFVEEYIKGREYTVAMCPYRNGIFTFPILGINPKNEFYDYEAKYSSGLTEFEIPAKIGANIESQMLNEVKKAYEALGCQGVCRIDVIVRDDLVYAIENNTQPGMTETSDVPEMAKAMGLEMRDIVLFILGLKLSNKERENVG